jgi:hypothetical protein
VVSAWAGILYPRVLELGHLADICLLRVVVTIISCSERVVVAEHAVGIDFFERRHRFIVVGVMPMAVYVVVARIVAIFYLQSKVSLRC